MEKINIAEILKDCPTGMELDCTMYEDVTLIHVLDGIAYPVKIDTPVGIMSLNKYGCCSNDKHSKCIIFPKGKTTWEGFVPPRRFHEGDWVVTDEGDTIQIATVNPGYYILNNGMEFCKSYVDKYWHLWTIEDAKDGDVLHSTGRYNDCIFIFNGLDNWGFDEPNGDRAVATGYCCISVSADNMEFGIQGPDCVEVNTIKPATKEQRDLLFAKMKEAGYKWNADTKTLEKLITPKFKVGDRIILKDNPHNMPSIRIKAVTKSHYILEKGRFIYMDSANEKYALVDKFDINTLVPFESRVLVRDNDNNTWQPSFWGYYEGGNYFAYKTVRGFYNQCIPYEGNEHLLGTKGDCEEFYKTWKKRS